LRANWRQDIAADAVSMKTTWFDKVARSQLPKVRANSNTA
jgi:hypothetical protein